MTSDDMAATVEVGTFPAVTPRLPSSRPLDRRWDASRGLSFSRELSLRRDYTWSRKRGITFADAMGSKQQYATRPPPRPAPGGGKTIRSGSSTLDPYSSPSLASTAVGGGNAPLPAQFLNEQAKLDTVIAEQNKELQEKDQQLQRKDQQLQGKDQQLQEKDQQLQEKDRQLQEKDRQLYEKDRQSQEKEQEKDRQSREKTQEKDRQSQDLRDNEYALRKTAEDLQRTVQDLKKQLESQEPDIRKKVTDDAILEAREQVTTEVAVMQQSEKELRKQYNIVLAANLRLETRLNATSSENKELEAELLRRRVLDQKEREVRKESRKTYPMYHRVFDDCMQSFGKLSNAIDETERASIAKIQAWQNTGDAFQAWCAGQSATWWPVKYNGLQKIISTFLTDSRKDAEAQADCVRDKRESLWKDVDTLTRLAHQSRFTTRTLRLEDDMSEIKTADSVHRVTMWPFDDLLEWIENTPGQLSQSRVTSGDSFPRRAREMQRLRDVRADQIGSLRRVMACWARLQNLNTLPLATLERKEQFIHTAAFDYDIKMASSSWQDAIRTHGKGRQELRQRGQESHGQIRQELDAYGELVFRRAAIERQLGSGQDQKKELDKKILMHIEKQEQALFAQLDRWRKGFVSHTVERIGLPRKAIPNSRLSAGKTALRSRASKQLTNSRASSERSIALEGPTKARHGHLTIAQQSPIKSLGRERRRLRAMRAHLVAAYFVDQQAVAEIERGLKDINKRISLISKDTEKSDAEPTGESRKNGSDQKDESGDSDRPQATHSAKVRRMRRPSRESRSFGCLRFKPTSTLMSAYASNLRHVDALYSGAGDSDLLADMDHDCGIPPAAFNPVSCNCTHSGIGDSAPPLAGSGGSSDDSSDGQAGAAFPDASDRESSLSADDSFDIASTASVQYSSSEAPVELTYEIPPEDFRTALMASKSSSGSFWKYTLYKSPEGARPTRHYCKTLEASERVCKLFLSQPVLGFDIEWEVGARPESGNIKRNISLIQIACEDRIALFQLAMFKGSTSQELMPPTLQTILEDFNVAKAGVNVAGDFNRLRKCLGVNGQGIFELSHLYKVVRFSETQTNKVNRKPFKLSSQVEDILHLPLFKGEVRTSAWSRELGVDQTDYAASDAYAGFRLYHALDAMRIGMKPKPPRPAFWEENKPIVLGNGRTIMPQSRPTGRPKHDGKAAESADEEDDEFFDAVEDLEDLKLDDSAVHTSSSKVDYPSLPSIHESSMVPEHKHAEAVSSTLIALAQTPRPPDSPSPAIDQAEAWAKSHESTIQLTCKYRAKHAELRAYHLWHIQGYELKTVAALLREPPLALATVSSYVLEAVKQDELAFDVKRIVEPLKIMPRVVQARYRGIVERVTAAGISFD